MYNFSFIFIIIIIIISLEMSTSLTMVTIIKNLQGNIHELYKAQDKRSVVEI
jgi:hypothetical protein